uniref:DUF1365 domain-containing protein n=1 Tax=Ascaris lumbricoides TaxID=6252 RepID=A0A0M3HW46_ASCLU
MMQYSARAFYGSVLDLKRFYALFPVWARHSLAPKAHWFHR